MPIVIPRDGPVIIDPNIITQEQRDKLWEQIVKNWAARHPEAFKNNKEEITNEQ